MRVPIPSQGGGVKWPLPNYFGALLYVFCVTLFTVRVTLLLAPMLRAGVCVWVCASVSGITVASNWKTTGWSWKLLGLDWNICCDNARSNSALLTSWPWPLTVIYSRILSIQALSSECLKLASSFSVWRHVFRISRSPLSFKVMRLMSRSRSQNSGSAQVSAPFGHGLMFHCI